VGWLLAFGVLGPASAQEPSLEYAVKATYLYKFAPFVEWPTNAAEFPDGSFTICVVGDNPLGGLLDRAVHDQDVDGHTIEIRRLPSVTGNPGCAMMFVSGSDTRSASGVLAAVRGLPILTVTDGASNPDATGIINFVITDGRVRFDIDNAAAAASGLTISSKLLSLAVRVLGKG
jgi:hypothetical protein